MLQVRRFGPEVKTPLRRPGSRGLSARLIQLPADSAAGLSAEELSRRFDGPPIIVNRPNTVVALYLDEHSEIDEHGAPEPILFLVTGGRGFVRIGGPQGATLDVSAGDAVLWPPNTPHKAWSADEALQAIAFHYSAEPAGHDGQTGGA